MLRCSGGYGSYFDIMVVTFKLAYYCERLKVGEDYYSILGFGVSVSNAADYVTRKMVV